MPKDTLPFRIDEIRLLERPVKLRMPFRFGVVTLTEAPQAFVRVRIGMPDGTVAWGVAAEVLAPKWFDKNTALSNEDNFDQLRRALCIARDLYVDGERRTSFGHYAAHYAAQIEACARLDLNPLVACFGPALIDRAALDALCRTTGMSFYQAMRRNLVGMAPESVAADLAGFDMDAFLRRLAPRNRIAARHTVGMVDPITAADQPAGTRVDDGLPETLEEVIAAYGHGWFKIKVGGDVKADLDRLTAIAAVLDRSGTPYRSTLDGNEQYENADAVIALWRKMAETPALARLVDSVAFIEQPIARKAALARDITALSALKPVIVDESDSTLDVFPEAKTLGYAGVSSKACKGFYKSVINAARAAQWNAAEGGSRYFLSGEDLTTQAGFGVQQDLALVSLLGIDHVERNGHHYVNGLAATSRAEQIAFLVAHPDLYVNSHGATRLRIDKGWLSIGSLDCRGFGCDAMPDWTTMTPMPEPPKLTVAKSG